MSTEKISNWLTVGANLGVLLGLLLLIIEIGQNSDLVRVQIEQDRSDSYVNWLRGVSEGEHMPRIYLELERLEGSFQERMSQLDPVDAIRYNQMLLARFYDFENLFYQYSSGFVSDEYWEERIVPSIKIWAPRWNATINPPNGPNGRIGFKEEVNRLLQD